MTSIYVPLTLSLFLTSCSLATVSSHPRVIIDSAFAPEELSGIADGLEAWHSAVPEFEFHPYLMSHSQIIGSALSAEYADTIYIVRNVGVNDHDCPGVWRKIGDNTVARSFLSEDQAIICIDSAYVNDHGSRWKAITLHEVGHSMHIIEHRPPPSVMASPFQYTADEPSPDDIAHMRLIWNLP